MAQPSRREVIRSLTGSAIVSRLPLLAASSSFRSRLANDPDLNRVLAMSRDLLSSGLNAGSGYPEVWIRDTNTFLETALQVNDPALFRTAFLNFLLLQGPDGDIVDGYVAHEQSQEPPYRMSPALPGYVAHKNTVETDQESSLVLAVARYVRLTGDASFLQEHVDGVPVRERLEHALDYPLAHRSDPQTSLLWGGTTIDWGDVAPERLPGTKLFPESHRAIGIYHNALFACAIRDFMALPDTSLHIKAHWQPILERLKMNSRHHLWQGGPPAVSAAPLPGWIAVSGHLRRGLRCTFMAARQWRLRRTCILGTRSRRRSRACAATFMMLTLLRSVSPSTLLIPMAFMPTPF